MKTMLTQLTFGCNVSNVNIREISHELCSRGIWNADAGHRAGALGRVRTRYRTRSQWPAARSRHLVSERRARRLPSARALPADRCNGRVDRRAWLAAGRHV